MENEFGFVTITCRKCKFVSVMDDAGIVERMTGYSCPNCRSVMSGREIAFLKGMYYLRLSQGTGKSLFRTLHHDFNCKIDLGVHYK